MRKMLTDLRLKIWKSHKTLGPNKELRLTRTYEYFGKGVLDITWCMRDNRNVPSDKKHSSQVITERCSSHDAMAVIRHVEKNELPRAIKSFLSRLGVQE